MNLRNNEQVNQTISDVLRGMQHAVNSAQESLQDSQIRFMERYFHPTTHEPYVNSVKLPNGKVIHIPEMTLIPQNTLLIDEIEMDFAIRISSMDVKAHAVEHSTDSEISDNRDSHDNIEIKRSSFGVFFGNSKKEKRSRDERAHGIDPATDVIQIKIRFKATDEPEATARIRDMLNKTISD